jgi:nucleoside-diphosphate-sugar epimerase
LRVILAGASGVIGRSLTGLLIEAGHGVIGMTRSVQRAEEIRSRGAEAVVCDALEAVVCDALEAVVCDALEADAVRSAVVTARPEAVIHELTDLPARIEPRKYKTQLAGTNRLRREGTRNLVAAAKEAGAGRLVAQSVAFAYAPTGDWIKDEDAPLALDSRPPMDEAIGAIAELERGSSGVYNMDDDDPARAHEWIPAYASAIGAKRPLRVPKWIGRVGGRAAVSGMTTQRGARNAKAKRELGWTPQHASWRDGFRTAAG